MPADLETQYFALLDAVLRAREKFVGMRDSYRFRAQDNASPHGLRIGCQTKARTLGCAIERMDHMIARNRQAIEERWGAAAYPLK
jgi:hypothetical protein